MSRAAAACSARDTRARRSASPGARPRPCGRSRFRWFSATCPAPPPRVSPAPLRPARARLRRLGRRGYRGVFSAERGARALLALLAAAQRHQDVEQRD